MSKPIGIAIVLILMIGAISFGADDVVARARTNPESLYYPLAPVNDLLIAETNSLTPFVEAENVEFVSQIGEFALDVAVKGNYVYVTAEDGPRIINVANPSTPTEVGFYDTPGNATNIAVADNYVYVTDGDSRMRIINVSNPTDPTESGYYDTMHGSASVWDVAVAGNYAYVTDWHPFDGNGTGLNIINITNPAAPTKTGFYDTLGALGVAIAGNYAYVTDWSNQLRIINVSNPSAPTEAGFFSPITGLDVTVVNNYAYVANGQNGLLIISVSNPSAPKVVGSYITSGHATGVAVSGDYAYIVDGDSLRVIDISNPSTPKEVGFYVTPGVANEVAVDGDYIYVADREGGLLILRFTGSASTYSISGKIALQDGTPLEGVVVSVSFGHKDNTDANGEYMITDLDSGVYSVEATLDGYKFTPVSVTLPPEQTDVNLVAQLEPHDFHTGFRAQPHGYSFKNAELSPPVAEDFTLLDLQRMLGDRATCLIPNPQGGACLIYWPSAERIYEIMMENREGGSCNGIAVTSLRFYEDPSRLPLGRQHAYDVSVPEVRRDITYYQLMGYMQPIQDHFRNSQNSSTPSDVLNEIQTAIRNNESVVLSMYQEVSGGILGHSVVPYALEGFGNGLWHVMVYDNNHPSPNVSERYVAINLANDTWFYTWDGALIWGGDANDHTLFTTPLSLYVEPLEMPLLASNTHPDTTDNFDLVEEVSGEIWLSGKGHLLITDSQGRKIGFEGNDRVDEIPGADAIVTFGGLNIPIEPIYFIPLNDNYTILLDGEVLGETRQPIDPVSITQFGPGFFVSVDNIPLSASTKDELTIAADSTEVTYKASQLAQPDLHMTFETEATSLQIAILGVEVGNNQSVSLVTDRATKQVVFNGPDSNGGAYGLELILSDTTAKHIFQHSQVAIDAGDTHYIDYSGWKGNGSLTLQIDEGSDGTIDKEYELENETPSYPLFLPMLSRP